MSECPVNKHQEPIKNVADVFPDKSEKTISQKRNSKTSISDEQALAYARMCNAYLEHQDEMDLYKDSK